MDGGRKEKATAEQSPSTWRRRAHSTVSFAIAISAYDVWNVRVCTQLSKDLLVFLGVPVRVWHVYGVASDVRKGYHVTLGLE